jgi:protein-ribulosamine 3-kinase
LEFLSRQECICIPPVIFSGSSKEEQVLLLEWIISGRRSENFWKKFGEQLALLHRCTSDKCGFTTDNYMGALEQKNQWNVGWTDFFVASRIMPQVELAVQKDLLSKKHIDLFEQIYKKMDAIFNLESPALLHGDLWSGNFMCNERSEPVLIDPAVYFGHRSMDLGMTTLFGGFDKMFYDAYAYHSPFPSNYREQWEICNLYPLLIHLNLFGRGYLAEIVGILKKFG